ncbi:MAG TPA: hypothetical protein VNV66_00995 [Pilimelia sp.]|nr:hypothetical protein [Pilimelia sp.]
MSAPSSYDMIIRGRTGESAYALLAEYQAVDAPVDLAVYGLRMRGGTLLRMLERAELLGLDVVVVRNDDDPPDAPVRPDARVPRPR